MTTTVKNLPSYAQPYVSDYVARANSLSQSGAFDEDYTPDTWATPNQNEQDAIDALYNRGINGDALVTAAKAYIKKVTDGDYEDEGTAPDYSTAKGNAINKPKISMSTFFNSLAEVTAYSAGVASPTFYGKDLLDSNKHGSRQEAMLDMDNFVTENDIKHGSHRLAIALAEREFADGETARLAGVAKREWYQNFLTNEFQMYQETSRRSLIQLEVMGEAIKTLVSTGSKKTQQTFRPPQANAILGGAMAGASLATSAGTPVGWGLAAGAALGLIGSN